MIDIVNGFVEIVFHDWFHGCINLLSFDMKQTDIQFSFDIENLNNAISLSCEANIVEEKYHVEDY
jgi:hypothetical protein